MNNANTTWTTLKQLTATDLSSNMLTGYTCDELEAFAVRLVDGDDNEYALSQVLWSEIDRRTKSRCG